MKNKTLLLAGYLSPIIFWSTLIICGLISKDYSHSSNLVSELGYLGTNTQYIFTIGLVITSILSLLFIFGLLKIANEIGISKFPILIIFTFSFSIFGAAVFPLPLYLHGILGSPSLIMPLSPLLALVLWKNQKIPSIKIVSGIVTIIMLLGFLTFLPDFMDNYIGLKQRFFHISWSIWFIYLSYVFSRLNNELNNISKKVS